MTVFYELIKTILFKLPPETAHHVALQVLKWAHAGHLIRPINTEFKPVTVMGLTFPNPIGIAAGLDKNGDYIDALGALGLGFIEIGTVTPKPQIGHPKPRLFRFIKEEALINRMGFNNKGINYLLEQVKNKKYQGILGINIGKNRDTALENAVDDYVLGFKCMAPFASYITINISSPNTPGLRDLQHVSFLQNLVRALKEVQQLQSRYVPLVIKISPDLTTEELQEMVKVFLEEKVDGIIATNTTVSRKGVEQSPFAKELGGLSGKPLFSPSTELLQKLHSMLNNQIPLIGCGGIFSTDDITSKLKAGANLVQIYTGLVYRGFNRLIENKKL